MNHRVVLAGTICVLAVAIGACNAKSPETTDPARADGIAAQAGLGLPASSGIEPKSGVPALEAPLEALSAEHFAAFDLLANRPLAHRIEHANEAPTVAVDAISADFVRYVHGNHANDWMLNTAVEGGHVAGVKGRTAQMWVPALRPEQKAVVRTHLYNPARGHNALTITLNGHKLPDKSLKEGWQTIEVAIDDLRHLRADNTLNMTFSNMGRIGGNLSGGGFAWVRIGAPLPAQPLAAVKPSAAGAEAGAEAGSEGSEGQGASASRAEGESAPNARPEELWPSKAPLAQGPVTLADDNGLAWFVWIPTDAKLDLGIEAKEGCGPTVELFTEAGKGAVVSSLKVERLLVLGRGEQQQTAIDLSAHANQIVRLEIRPSAACTTPLKLNRAALVVPGVRPQVPKVERPKYIVFWMIDTLRADHLPIHFETDVQAPHLKRLAEEGASFKLAYVQGTESRVSHASLFTGLYPNRHKVLVRGKVDPQVPILSEYIKKAGYKTGVIASNGYLSHLLNLNRGWDYYTNNIHEETAVGGMFMARGGVRWATENKDNPFFLYLGTIDPHVTYRRHEDLIGLYEKEPYSGRYDRACSGEDLGLIKGKKLDVSPRDRLRIHNLYKNEITYNDQAFGFLRAQLEELGIWEQTMVVVTADHGDEFWEHGNVGHGHNVHQEMVHVPLIIYYPPLIPANTVVEAGVDIVDILPTLIDVVGSEAAADKQGKSLIPLIHNMHGGYPEPAVATQYLIHYAMQLQQWKIYLRRGDFQLYDRIADPKELTNVASDHPLASRWLLDSVGLFRAHRERWDKRTWGTSSNLSDNFTEIIGSNK
ncbi:MAG: sulfatase [Bradymonadaceae bacterium]|nr:sulfatase [Lujinxingiaceae bacterium]